MKDTIYLTIDRSKVKQMTKSFTGTKKGEICVKLNVEVDNKAFQPPVVEQRVYVAEWHDGVDLEDIQFNENIITEEEAELVKKARIEKMKGILEEQGYSIERIEEELQDN